MEKPETGEPQFPSIEEKRKSLINLQSYVEEMREKLQKLREAKQRERAKEEICYWMDNAIFPFLLGIAEDTFHEPLTEGIARLIREGKNPFHPKEDWNRTRDTETALSGFLAQPQTKVLTTLAKPFIRQKMEWINLKAEWIREEILKEEYPDIYAAIMKTEGGKEWLDQLIADFVKTLKRIIR